MIVSSVGLPGRFAEWTDTILLRLAERTMGPAALVAANLVHEIAVSAFANPGRHLVVASRQPSEALRNALVDTGARFVVSLDEPRAAFHSLVTRQGLEWRAAIRAAAGSCAAILSFAQVPEARVLLPERDDRNPLATAMALAHWLDCDIDPIELASLVGDRADTPALAAAQGWIPWWDRLSASDRASVEGALNGYIDVFNGGQVGRFSWARDLFFVGDAPSAAADRIIDLRGPVRYLFFGPYIALPPGQWGATVVLAASRGAENQSYTVEIMAGPRFDCLGRGTIEPQGKGLSETTVPFTVTASTAQPIELRIANSQPAGGGRLALAAVTLEPRNRIPADFEALLDP